MNRPFITTVVLAIAIGLAPWSYSNQKSDHIKNCGKNDIPSTSLTVFSKNIKETEHTNSTTQNNTPKRNASTQWILIIIAGITGLFVGWQALETRRSANASAENIRISRETIETQIERERARIRIGIDNLALTTENSGPQCTFCWIENYGPTIAFVDVIRATLFFANHEKIAPDYKKCRSILYSESIDGRSIFPSKFLITMEPNSSLSEKDIIDIRTRKAFIHFYSLVIYRDIFHRKRSTKFHLIWRTKSGGVIKGQIMDFWEPMCSPEDTEAT